MTAKPGPPLGSPFLAFVGEAERKPLNVAIWLALGIPLALIGMVLVFVILADVGPHLPDQANAVFRGPHRLLLECKGMALSSFAQLAIAAALLGAGRQVFQREAWTFVTPVRPFAPALLGAGVAVFALLLAAEFGVEHFATGETWAAPILARDAPLLDRWVYGLFTPLALMVGAVASLIYRGVLLQATAALAVSRPGLSLMNGLLFAMIQSLAALDPSPVAFVERTMFGAMLAWSVLELGGLEFGIGALVVTGAGAALLAETPSTVDHVAAFHWADLLKTATWLDFGEIAGVTLAALAAIEVIKRLRARYEAGA
jgi:hypothetical protein